MSLIIEAETNVDTDPCVTAWSNKLFVGADNGSIYSFDDKLKLVSSWEAHGVQVFAIAASDGNVYSSSNDGGVRVWNFDGEKLAELPASGADIGSIAICDMHVYTGDELGNINVYKGYELKAKYNVLEEVKDIAINPPFMFTARHLCVTVTEIKPEQSKERFITLQVMEGCAPLRVFGSYLVVTSRGGKSIQLHEASLDTTFKKIHDIKVSDMIVTTLSVSDNIVWTGGWDGHVRRWKITENKLHPAGEINLGCCINDLVAPTGAGAFVVLTGGKILKIKAE